MKNLLNQAESWLDEQDINNGNSCDCESVMKAIESKNLVFLINFFEKC